MVAVGLVRSASGQLPEASPPPDTDQVEPAGDADLPPTVAPPPPPLPRPPDGILPVAIVERLSYGPSERPRARLFDETLVVITGAGVVEGHDALTGEFRWKLGLPGEQLFDPVGVNEQLLLSSPSGKLMFVDVALGTIAREEALPFELALPPFPVVATGDVVFATPTGEVLVYALAELDAGPRFRAQTREAPVALSGNASLIVVSGSERTLSVLDARDGSERWHFIGRGAFAPATFRPDGKRLFVGDEAGEFYSLDTRNGNVDFRWSTGAAIRSAPLVEPKRVFVTSLGNYLYAYDSGGGAEQWRAPLPGRPATTPVRIYQRFVVATLDGILIEVNPSTGVLGKSYGLPGELGAVPAFRIVPAPVVDLNDPALLPGGLLAPTLGDEVAIPVEPPAALPEASVSVPEVALFEDVREGVVSVAPQEEAPPAPAPEETDTEGASVEGAPGNVLETPAPTPREPLWFELTRIAVPLRNGEIVLLRHAPPAPPPPPVTPGAPVVPPVPAEDTTVPKQSPTRP